MSIGRLLCTVHTYILPIIDERMARMILLCYILRILVNRCRVCKSVLYSVLDVDGSTLMRGFFLAVHIKSYYILNSYYVLKINTLILLLMQKFDQGSALASRHCKIVVQREMCLLAFPANEKMYQISSS